MLGSDQVMKSEDESILFNNLYLLGTLEKSYLT